MNLLNGKRYFTKIAIFRMETNFIVYMDLNLMILNCQNLTLLNYVKKIYIYSGKFLKSSTYI